MQNLKVIFDNRTEALDYTKKHAQDFFTMYNAVKCPDTVYWLGFEADEKIFYTEFSEIPSSWICKAEAVHINRRDKNAEKALFSGKIYCNPNMTEVKAKAIFLCAASYFRGFDRLNDGMRFEAAVTELLAGKKYTRHNTDRFDSAPDIVVQDKKIQLKFLNGRRKKIVFSETRTIQKAYFEYNIK